MNTPSPCLRLATFAALLAVAVCATAGARTTLETAPVYSAGSPYQERIAAADFDGDGDLDLATVGSAGTLISSHTVSILFNDGAGRFGAPTLYDVGGVNPEDVAVADMNDDQWPDLVVAVEGEAFQLETMGVSVLLNNGAGAFGAATFYEGGINPDALAIADFDDDNDPDVLVGGIGSVFMFINDGAGSLSLGDETVCGDQVAGVAAADFDGDNMIDAIVANGGDGNAQILLNDGAGALDAAQTFPVGGLPFGVVAADFDGDGHQDAAVSDTGPDDASVSVFLNDGAGTMTRTAQYFLGGPPRELAVGDFNGDNRPDIAVANNELYDVAVLLNQGAGAFGPPAFWCTHGESRDVIAAELDGSGYDDIAAVSFDWNDVAVLINRSDGLGRLVASRDYITSGFSANATGVTLEFNGDDSPDIAINSINSSGVVVIVNQGDGTFSGPTEHEGGFRTSLLQPQFLAADLDGDTLDDIVGPDFNDGRLAVLMNQGAAFAPPAYYESGDFFPAPQGLSAGRMDGDGVLDVVVGNLTMGNVAILRGLGGGALSAPTVFQLDESMDWLDLADVDDDGALDVVGVGTTPDTVGILFGDGAGGLATPPVVYPVGEDPKFGSVDDFNGDGHPDVATINDIPFDVSVLLNDGAGAFGAAVSYPSGTESLSTLASLDLEVDGDRDLVTCSPENRGVLIFENDGAGGFSSPTLVLSGRSPGTVLVADVDGDGDEDVITVNLLGQNVTVTLNRAEAAVTVGELIDYLLGLAGLPPAKQSQADVNADGVIDVADAIALLAP